MRRGIGTGRRIVTFAFATVLALVLAGDRASTATVPAAVFGQDPLEVLKLAVRPNVIVVLDSSGSMTQTVDTTQFDTGSGDHPRSKLYQAKAVLQTFVQQNQARASFQFATYTQGGEVFNNQAAGNDRFQYFTSGTLTPNMATNDLTVRGDSTNTTRGLQSWMDIRATWNNIYYGEGFSVVCRAVVPPQFYAVGTDLATAMQTAMNSPAACTGGSRQNTYTVSYANGIFTFGTSAGTAPFGIRWADTPNNIAGALGMAGAGNSGLTGGSVALTVNLTRGTTNTTVSTAPTNITIAAGTAFTITSASRTCFNGSWSVLTGVTNGTSFTYRTDTCTNGNTGTGTLTFTVTGTSTTASGTPYTLLYRSTSTTGGGGGVTNRYEFTETVAGVSVTNYQLRAGRLFNGEVVRVDSNGAVCGMTYPTAAQMTNPPQVTLQLVSSGCGGDVAGQSAVFKFAGADITGNDFPCYGAMSRVPLIPCDLAMPPAATQFSNISPYIDRQNPFTGATGTPVGYTETQDGSWATASITLQPSAKADGNTPIANSLIDIKGLADSSGKCLVQSNGSPCTDPTTQTCTAGTCVNRNFYQFWNTGQVASAGPPQAYALDAIKNHLDPKEKTIVLFVTDGNDTCGGRGTTATESDALALRAAYYAERLNTPLDAAQPASAVQTYVIGFGGAFSGSTPTRLNWIAWGGSGMGLGLPGQPDVPTGGTSCQSWGTGTLGNMSGTSKPTLDGTGQVGTCAWNATATDLTTNRGKCTTCQDAFVAPDAATLATQLQAIIDQGASSGEFTAQQAITESVYEYVDLAGAATYDARNPGTRYGAIVPTEFISSFTLPGFNGQVKAYQNDGAGNAVLKWSAGDKLSTAISTGIGGCDTGPSPGSNVGGGPGECVFTQLTGGATHTTIATSSAKIKRRIYTTSGNGVFNYTPASLMTGSPIGADDLMVLWPPTSVIAPADYTTIGSLDVAMGLPNDTPSCTLRTGFTTCVDQWISDLKKNYKACLGSNLASQLPAGSACNSAAGSVALMKAMRREAREMVLAFMAGAAPVPSNDGWLRTTGSAGSPSMPPGSLLYKARSWALADSTLATAAVVTPPLPAVPSATPYQNEYKVFRDGPRGSSGSNPDTAGTQILQGFGLRNPDNDGTVGGATHDTRTALKPVMTVVYAPANDMLHAFRAGPCYSPTTLPANCVGGTAAESGGEELWGFVPYDELNALSLRFINDPQGRSNHVYMLARGVRYADVFVPGSMTGASVGGVALPSSPAHKGVWRRILFFGRGIGGKYLTALDVTAPGAYTRPALQTQPPIPLWSRGNPDTRFGSAGGSSNGSATDLAAYAKMGQTWSMPVVVYVGSTNAAYATARASGRPGCVTGPCAADYVLFVGSGYPTATGEGTTFYTLDALSGDVIASADIEVAASANGLARSNVTDQNGVAYANAIVANPAAFQPQIFSLLQTVHPAAAVVTRVYVGDLYGRMWKFVTADPSVAIPLADLGVDQPVATAASLLGQPPQPSTPVPYVFVAAGNDSRRDGPFRFFAFRDEGTDTRTTTDSPVTTTYATAPGGGVGGTVTTYPPVVSLYLRTFDQGTPQASCSITTEAFFRGTVQPTSGFECSAITGGNCIGAQGRVFFAGTRLSLPNTKFAPPTPLACGSGQYPCRSEFDSIIYALGAQSGLAAFNLHANASEDQAYDIFTNSRLAAISMQADPDPSRGGSSFEANEGLMKGTVKPPPPPGVPPTQNTATANVNFQRSADKPAPTTHESSVCQ